MVPRSVKKKITDGFNKNKTITNIDCFVHYSYNIDGNTIPLQWFSKNPTLEHFLEKCAVFFKINLFSL